jgi:hypothetical protein
MPRTVISRRSHLCPEAGILHVAFDRIGLPLLVVAGHAVALEVAPMLVYRLDADELSATQRRSWAVFRRTDSDVTSNRSTETTGWRAASEALTRRLMSSNCAGRGPDGRRPRGSCDWPAG